MNIKLLFEELNISKQLIKSIGPLSIYLVDGDYIRSHLKREDEEFTNCAQHVELPSLIPKDEIWIDKATKPSERPFYIDGMIALYKAMKAGKSHKEAAAIANRKEAAERARSTGPVKSKTISIDKKLWKKEGDLKVYLVSGEEVRDTYKIDFTEGGHSFVYSFVPENEIWIDKDDIDKDEWKYVLKHEMVERELMKDKHLSYPDAHKKAGDAEFRMRQK